MPVRLIACAALLLAFAGCSDEPRTTAPAATSGAFTPEHFADIPLPRGYVLSSERDQLAVALAAGTVRRFDVWMEQRENAEPQAPSALLGEMERDLVAKGWAPVPEHAKLEWVKEQERLVLETGRTGGRTSIRIRLRPAPLAGP